MEEAFLYVLSENLPSSFPSPDLRVHGGMLHVYSFPYSLEMYILVVLNTYWKNGLIPWSLISILSRFLSRWIEIFFFSFFFVFNFINDFLLFFSLSLRWLYLRSHLFALWECLPSTCLFLAAVSVSKLFPHISLLSFFQIILSLTLCYCSLFCVSTLFGMSS